MQSLNKIMLIGNLGKNPEMRFTPTGKPVTNFTLATNSKWTTNDGERREQTDWFGIVTWGRLAETCNQYLVKGKLVYVEGRVSLRTWEKPDGSKGTSLEVVANRVLFLGSNEQVQSQELEPEDIPF